MPQPDRRHVLRTGIALAASPSLLLAGCDDSADTPSQIADTDNTAQDRDSTKERKPMKVHYLEIVTSDAESLCGQYSKVHDAAFGEPVPALGGARTAKLDDGSLIGIRAPMHDAEKSVVRPYLLVKDIKASVETASAAGAKVAVPPMEIPEYGTCAIVMHGGIECGFWQL